MIIHTRKDLSGFSTFGLKATSRYFVEFDDDKDLLELSEFVLSTHLPSLSLGGGSNIIFCADYPGVVVKNTNSLIERISKSKVRVNAGCSLDEFVAWCIDNGLHGLEALSGIPGTIGGAVALNAGAYGSMIKNTLTQVRVYDIRTRKLIVFTVGELHYWHRSSIFREKRGNDWIILDATFKLRERFVPPSHAKIAMLPAKLKKDPLGFRNTIIDLRSHMPDPLLHKNSGSFFLNPTITSKSAENLREVFPNIAARPYTKTHTQVSAGWLLDTAGLKGKRFEGLYFHNKHANIIVNEHATSGRDIAELIRHVQQLIYEMFGLSIVAEPLLIGEEYWQGALLKPSVQDVVRS